MTLENLNSHPNNDRSWVAPVGILSGQRERNDEIPKQVNDFIEYHKSETTDRVMSLPLPETFFNESCYPEYEFIEEWIYDSKVLFNAYLCILRTCSEMLLKYIVKSPKDPTLFKYFTDCQNHKNKILQTKKKSIGSHEEKKTGKSLGDEFLATS